MSDIENFDPTEIKVPGREEPLVQEETQEEQQQEVAEENAEPQTEETNNEEVNDAEDSVEETPQENETTEEDQTQEVSNEEESSDNQDDDKNKELLSTLDNIAKQVSNGSVNDLEGLIEDYKSLRDSESNVFKDDFIKNAVDYYNKTGSLTPYLEATSVNFDEMSDTEIMRYNLKKDNPSLSARAIERLYQRDIVSKYSLDKEKYDEDEVELGEELLKADADRLRNKFTEDQKNFIKPDIKEDAGAVQQQEAMEKFAQTVNSNQFTKDLEENKRILVEYNDEKFSFEVEDPSLVKEMTLDSNKFFKLFSDENGQIDLEKWYRVATYAMDPETYDMSLISHGVNLGQEKVVKDLKNPSKVTKGSPSSKEPETVVEGIMGEFLRGGGNIKVIK